MITAHIGGMPIEETLGYFGPGLLVAVSAFATQLGARLRRKRSRPPRTRARRS